MRILLLFITIITLSSSFAQTTTVTVNVNGVNRTYRLYVPAIYNPNAAVPLVFNFHGYTSTSAEQEVYGDFRPIADTANFIIVHPQGLIVNGNTGWNNFTTQADAQGDIDFTEKMITTLSTQYNIDQNRIYSTGMSNGGFMSYDLACFLSSRFAAVASVTGSMTALHKNLCNPSHPTPIMQIHGTTDAVVPYAGSGSLGALHIDTLVKFWRNFNQCNPNPVFTALPNVVTSDNCTAEHYVYTGGTQGSTVEFYKIINGGHTWPGATFAVNGNTNMDFSASKEIWRFFSKYKLNELTASINTQDLNSSVSVYPNPFQNTFSVDLEKFDGLSIEVVNATGKVIHVQPLTGKSTLIQMEKAQSGLYIYRIQDNLNTVKLGKVVVL